jgi:uroporphyrinogen decarboxylase
VRILATWYPEPGTWHPCPIPTFQILTKHYPTAVSSRLRMRDALLRACRREPVPYTPVWFMRQAGRALPEYRRLREKYSFAQLLQNPDLAVEVTVLPVRKLGVDAAILFADLATPLTGTGVRFSVRDTEGLVIETPVRAWDDLRRLGVPEPAESVPYVLETVRRCRQVLDVPLIGFVGAPFTVATYLIEGRTGRDYHATRAFMYRDPDRWQALMTWLTDVLTKYAVALVEAGVQVVQVFDSWVGALSPSAYRAFVLPYVRRLIQALQARGVPVIHFATGTAGILPLLREAGGDVIGVDWRVAIDWAWAQVGPNVGIQGNLDPAVLLADVPTIRAAAQEVLDRVGGRPGHIFNLGHGVLPQTPVEHLQALVDWVHERTRV